MKHNVSEEVIFPESKTFLQFVADCTDHDMAALDGGETHHGLASVVIADGGGISATCPAHRVPRDGRGNWDGTKSCGGTKIRRYFGPGVPTLAKAILRAITRVGKYCSVWGMLIHSISILAFTDGIGALSKPFKTIIF